jgi:2-C-methyl-D-erythritol 4-phosphate cytidylyltransferase/2-C-methyl-D-erythritol 2,4-cyclodiphosphate synthase
MSAAGPGATVALVVAGGRGERLGGPVPKQYRRLAGVPVLRRAVLALRRCPGIATTLVVRAAEHDSLYREAVAGLDLPAPADGGPSRQASVLAGLEALAPLGPARVLVHDAARPLVPRALVERLITALADADAVVPALPAVDTLRRFDGRHAAAEVDRAGLFRMQTPQGFTFVDLLAAHRALAGRALGDDAAVMLAAGHTVVRVDGDEAAMKITTEDDLTAAARRLLPLRRATGLGFDVHRLVPGRRLVLLGIEIPHPLGLDGHSDADVGLHAVTDAILGALGAGDIGAHFPPSEPRWKDADSAVFVRRAAALAEAAGAEIEHVDVTIIGERPKIAPWRAAMVARLAGLLGLPEGRVGLKATTTERLGFTGRGEGLAAQAVASLAFREAP